MKHLQQNNNAPTQEQIDSLNRLSHANYLLGGMLVLSFMAFIGWSVFSKLDIVAFAEGTISPATKVQQVQHLEGGIIKELLVREGDLVEAGQALATLSATTSRADKEELNLRIEALKVDVLRFEAEAQNADAVAIPDDLRSAYPELVQRAEALFQARRAAQMSKQQAQQNVVEASRQESAEIQARLRNTRQRLKLVKEQIRIGEKLIRQNLSNRYEHIERLKEANGLQSRIDEDNSALKRLKAELSKAQNGLDQIERDYQSEVQQGLGETRRSLGEFQQRLTKFQDNLERTVLRAPVTGTVKSLYTVTEGGVIRPGDTVMDIVPGDDRLIVEARLLPQDIGYIQVGQDAFVQLASADASRLGNISGTVRHISPDTLVTDEGESFYVVHVETERSYFGDDNERVVLFPGMIVSAGIITGRRTVMEYVLSPFIQNLPFVFSER